MPKQSPCPQWCDTSHDDQPDDAHTLHETTVANARGLFRVDLAQLDQGPVMVAPVLADNVQDLDPQAALDLASGIAVAAALAADFNGQPLPTLARQ
ncbi:DUF6907 domain-containing protein [Calidifontibacter indicus]|uniref:Uncharacterized protein n=1 Tax=Calidifontibacter indicus TaxID=419650 RepID=A0A3D9UVK0_9MICO|nr:hypothetical protein [Calidifontibacter indicus]REF30645.1 hypothetical protein DFJ65_1660 [Calidifontibacter indicus]